MGYGRRRINQPKSRSSPRGVARRWWPSATRAVHTRACSAVHDHGRWTGWRARVLAYLATRSRSEIGRPTCLTRRDLVALTTCRPGGKEGRQTGHDSPGRSAGRRALRRPPVDPSTRSARGRPFCFFFFFLLGGRAPTGSSRSRCHCARIRTRGRARRRQILNYGLNRVRFPAPQRRQTGGRRRGSRPSTGAGRLQVGYGLTFERDGGSKPCASPTLIFATAGARRDREAAKSTRKARRQPAPEKATPAKRRGKATSARRRRRSRRRPEPRTQAAPAKAEKATGAAGPPRPQPQGTPAIGQSRPSGGTAARQGGHSSQGPGGAAGRPRQGTARNGPGAQGGRAGHGDGDRAGGPAPGREKAAAPRRRATAAPKPAPLRGLAAISSRAPRRGCSQTTTAMRGGARRRARGRRSATVAGRRSPSVRRTAAHNRSAAESAAATPPKGRCRRTPRQAVTDPAGRNTASGRCAGYLATGSTGWTCAARRPRRRSEGKAELAMGFLADALAHDFPHQPACQEALDTGGRSLSRLGNFVATCGTTQGRPARSLQRLRGRAKPRLHTVQSGLPQRPHRGAGSTKRRPTRCTRCPAVRPPW